jgi:uncharacterized protein
MHVPEFEWDSKKESLNVRKHGIDFTTASDIWLGAIMERIDDRHAYGEVRIIATGVAETRHLVVVYTWRGEKRRIISARRANARESAYYEEEIARRGRAPPD